ncbi:unnamed protein product [Arctia plantaginis]|uniref:Serpin domain-containing protein n=1 Tax=Arctia plantaginis TaxID=874455 RepID=A0A8S0Z044_ARCPL|nr:unnamed protein product [Arctia plantaginis]
MQAIVLIVLSMALCYAQVHTPYNDLPNRIGNFSIEALYHTSRTLQDGQNIIMSPLTIWTALAAIAEGAQGGTREEIFNAIRWRGTRDISNSYREISQWLKVNTYTVKLTKLNTMFVDQKSLVLRHYQDLAKVNYEMDVISLNFSDSVVVASVLNRAIADFTNGVIKQIVEPDYFQNSNMVLVSAIYFKGQWSVPFNTSETKRAPFYDSEGQTIGDVNMMHKRYTYPLSNFRQLQARVIELPYGDRNRMSMFVMLPNPGVSVENMLRNMQNLNLDSFFEEMRISKEEYPDDEVDCFFPRFKVESEIDLVDVLQKNFGITDLFDPKNARLGLIARTPVYVSKMFHRAQIEVTEEGTTAAAVTVAEFKSRSGIVTFKADRPFVYLIVEKETNTIVICGLYKQPSLY